MEGSSATRSTRPALTPVLVTLMKGSAATLSPTCFMAEKARAPPMDAPIATSQATFSLGAHSEYISS